MEQLRPDSSIGPVVSIPREGRRTAAIRCRLLIGASDLEEDLGMTYDLMSGMSGFQVKILVQISKKRMRPPRGGWLPDCLVFQLIGYIPVLLDVVVICY